MHHFDTKKFSLLYNDSDTTGNTGTAIDFVAQMSKNFMSNQSSDNKDVQQYFEKRLELKTLSRESRDLICLTSKCFAAQQYFLNSKIINLVEDQNLCALIVGNSKYQSNFNSKNQTQQYTLSDVMLELEFVKHDLNQQLLYLKAEQKETQKFKKQFNDLEDEMQCTIQSYKNIIDEF